jgi:hypothetical protein
MAPDGSFWPAAAAGWVERFKAFRDRRRLKPLLSLLAYLVVPLSAFQLILLQYPGLDQQRFWTATALILPAGALIVAVALAQERYPKGRRRRLALDGVYVILTLMWLLALLGGSPVVRSSYEGHPFSIDLWPLFALAVFTAGANFAHDCMEYMLCRTGGGRLSSPFESASGAGPVPPPSS